MTRDVPPDTSSAGRSPDQPRGEAVHASAVAIDGEGLLILGPSRSGKSRLSLALIEASAPGRPILLLGDDRILLSRRDGALIARPHPRTAGFIERRGLGILAAPFADRAPVGGIVTLGRTTSAPKTLDNFPRLAVVDPFEDGPGRSAAMVLGWWRGARTTPCRKPMDELSIVPKRLELVIKPRSYIRLPNALRRLHPRPESSAFGTTSDENRRD